MTGNSFGILWAEGLELHSNQQIQVFFCDFLRNHRTLGAVRVTNAIYALLPFRTLAVGATIASASRPLIARTAKTAVAITCGTVGVTSWTVAKSAIAVTRWSVRTAIAASGAIPITVLATFSASRAVSRTAGIVVRALFPGWTRRIAALIRAFCSFVVVLSQEILL
jgi:hypothetical protein